MATITGTQDRQEQQQEQVRPGRARTRTVKYLIALTPGERALLSRRADERGYSTPAEFIRRDVINGAGLLPPTA
jgi:hypothetical protein